MTTANTLVVLDWSSFFVSEPSGDVVPGHDANGYFFADMRHLSTWRLFMDGEPVRLLSSRALVYYSASIHGTPGGPSCTKTRPSPSAGIASSRTASTRTWWSRTTASSRSPSTSDFGSPPTSRTCSRSRSGGPRSGRRARRSSGPDHPAVRAGRLSPATVIVFSEPTRLEADRATFEVELEPRLRWRC